MGARQDKSLIRESWKKEKIINTRNAAVSWYKREHMMGRERSVGTERNASNTPRLRRGRERVACKRLECFNELSSLSCLADGNASHFPLVSASPPAPVMGLGPLRLGKVFRLRFASLPQLGSYRCLLAREG